MEWRRRQFLWSMAAMNLVKVGRPALSQPTFPTYERFVARASAELTAEWQFFSARLGLREQYLFFSDARIAAAGSPSLPLRRASPRNIDRFRNASALVSRYLQDAITKIGTPFGPPVTIAALQLSTQVDSTLKGSFEENIADMDSVLAFLSFFKEVAGQTGRFEFSILTEEDIFVGQMKAAIICNTLLPRNVMLSLLPDSPFWLFCSNKG